MTRHIIKLALVSSVALLNYVPASWALDADIFADQLIANFSSNGAEIEFADLSLNGNDVIMTDSFLIVEGDRLPLGNILFKNVEERDNGDYNIETTSFSNIDVDEDGVELTLDDIEIGNLTIFKDISASENMSDFIIYESLSTGPLNIKLDGAETFSFAASDFTADIANDNAMTFTGSIADISLNLMALPDRNAKQTAKAMGYDVLTGQMEMAGGWNAQTGQLELPLFEIAFDDVGGLNFTFDMSGYTLDFAAEFRDMQKKLIDSADHQKTQQAAGMALLGMMQQLTLNSASLTFDDASITEKTLAFIGQQQGMSADQMATAAKGMMPFLLAGLGMPSLQQQISSAANIYLDDPQNIEIKAEPSERVTFSQIMGAAMADPKAIVDLLNVQITANQ